MCIPLQEYNLRFVLLDPQRQDIVDAVYFFLCPYSIEDVLS